MEAINGCFVFAAPQTPEPIEVGPGETGGAYRVLMGMFPPGEPGPPPHTHPHTDEAFYLTEGEATFLLGDRELSVEPGSLVVVPRGMPHTVWNSGETGTRLIIISPGDADHLFVPVDAG